jgi:hypothetical protein
VVQGPPDKSPGFFVIFSTTFQNQLIYIENLAFPFKEEAIEATKGNIYYIAAE